MKLLIAILLLIPIYSKSQTCIVAVKTKNKIIVGSDSRISNVFFGYSNRKVTLYQDTGCKVFLTQKISIAVAGWYCNTIADSIVKSITNYSSLSDFEDILRRKAGLFILRKINSASKINKSMTDSVFKVEEFLSSIFVFGVDRDSLFLHEFGLKRVTAVAHGDVSGQWWTIPGDIAAIGTVIEIYDNKILQNKSIWKNGIKTGIINVINYAHSKHPDMVGGPIDMVEVTKKKSKWITKKTICN